MPLSLSEVLDWTQGQWVNAEQFQTGSGSSADKIQVDSLAGLAVSQRHHLAYFFSEEYKQQLPQAQAGILITGQPFVEPLKKSGLPLWKKSAVVACADPYLAMARLSEKWDQLIGQEIHASPVQSQLQIHPTAVVSPDAKLANGVSVGAFTVIEGAVEIGKNTVIYPQCYIGEGAKLGQDCKVFAGVKIYHGVRIGHRVRIHANSVIGADGFGYAPIFPAGDKNALPTGHQKIYHLGSVKVGDDVEFGAAVTVDRGTIEDTIIGNQVKLDDQVHIGHNARLDEGAVVCGASAMAGRVHLGRFCYIGGLTGIANNVFVGDGAKVGALSLITKDVPAGEVHLGNPQREYGHHFRTQAALNRLLKNKGKNKDNL